MGGPAHAGAPAEAGYKQYLHPGPWYKNRRLIVLNAWILLLLITSGTNGYDGSMMNGLQTLTQWQKAFNNPTGGKLGLLSAIQNIGGLAAYPFAPYMTDNLGRRVSIMFGAAIMILATIVQTASQNVGMFIGGRFLIGFGLGFAGNASPLLVTEIAYPSQRAVLTSTYNSLWYSGAVIAAWTTFGTFRIANSSWSWRIPSALQGLPAVLQILTIWFIPESPRFLISKGRGAEARKTLAYYHANGNPDDPLVKYEYDEIVAAIQRDREVARNVGYSALWRTPGNRRRMRVILALAFFSQWSGNGLVSYYLSRVFDTIGITNTAIQNLINALLTTWNLFWAIWGALYCDKIGRRPLFLWSTFLMLIFFSCQTALSAVYAKTLNQAAAHGVIAFIFLYYASYDIAYSPLIVSYTVEILPYDLRAKGFNVFGFAISLSLVFNQYVNPIALAKLQWKYYLVYVAWLAVELAFVFRYLVETKGRTLEETAAMFDGEDAVKEISHAYDVSDVQDIKEERSSVEKAES